MSRIDVLVAGGGPVGLATALLATQAGLHAVIVEPRPAPIDKACGEGLMPGGVAVLRRLGVEPRGCDLRGIRYLAASAAATADFPGPPGRGIRRTELHRALADAAERAGIETVPGRVTDVEQDEHGVTAAGLRARWLVGADGLHSTVRTAVFGGSAAGRPGRRRWGVRTHVAAAPWSEYVEVHWSPVGEAYVTPVAPDLVGIAVLTSCRATPSRLLAGFPQLQAHLTGPPAGPVRGAGPLRQPVGRRVAGRVLLVGDAAGYVDALTGEGLCLGFRCAEAAVARLRDGSPARYERDYLRITRTHRVLTGGLVAATRVPAVRRGIVPLAAAVPGLFRTAVGVLAR
jgi:flavin-dependent dehydrogenase